ncbi:MAG: hypothetical protein M3492_03795, partial [Actinomycetota bacterium]|nr:hypothetical protein [Actinomycetota bacterium]
MVIVLIGIGGLRLQRTGKAGLRASICRMGIYQRQLQPRLLNVVMGTKAAAEARGRVCAGLAGE